VAARVRLRNAVKNATVVMSAKFDGHAFLLPVCSTWAVALARQEVTPRPILPPWSASDVGTGVFERWTEMRALGASIADFELPGLDLAGECPCRAG